MKILILNGANLNLLGTREPEIYGLQTMESALAQWRVLFPEFEIQYTQSNHEGVVIDRLQEQDFDALILNPGAFTHYSYAIADALKSLYCPKIEVHISQIYKREAFRQKSVTACNCDALISGFGLKSYELALFSLKK